MNNEEVHALIEKFLGLEQRLEQLHDEKLASILKHLKKQIENVVESEFGEVAANKKALDAATQELKQAEERANHAQKGKNVDIIKLSQVEAETNEVRKSYSNIERKRRPRERERGFRVDSSNVCGKVLANLSFTKTNFNADITIMTKLVEYLEAFEDYFEAGLGLVREMSDEIASLRVEVQDTKKQRKSRHSENSHGLLSGVPSVKHRSGWSITALVSLNSPAKYDDVLPHE